MNGSPRLRICGATALLVGLALASPGNAAQLPTLRILEPTADEPVAGANVTVRVEAEGVVLGSRERNGAHVLLRLDDLPAMKSYAERFTFRGVNPGQHHLRGELRRPDGGAFEPPVVAEVRFRVAAQRPGAPGER